VNVGLKTIGSDLDTGITGLQWVMNAYTLAFASLLLTTGSPGDRVGPKPVMIAVLTLFTLASVACGEAGSIGTLITARLFQGIAAALCVPSSLALINIAFTDRQARARAIGLWAGTSSMALGAGPIVGGLLIEHFGWPSIFLINVPFGLIDIWLAVVHAPGPVKAHARSLDLAGQCLAILALAGLATGCIEAGQYGWSSAVVLGGFAMFLVAGTAFLATEARISELMLPLGLFTSASMNAASIVGTLINFGYYGVMFAISL
jgi:MFS transporter, DHA2 family, methylenomycin A resistance protein